MFGNRSPEERMVSLREQELKLECFNRASEDSVSTDSFAVVLDRAKALYEWVTDIKK